ncbi:AER079Cp [Eremothecium gossypii ATCC 10895]|uniref:Biogenesis of lysosome-related organelles complex 1 subunit BLS1 n=1 Tax=Eremothecium gossypii (strain ATCC 10895 / CBS 109.51 / FGSC 9923 / NRRL Y-1056) TaxID=284811 RepID=BL1S1_EREGS|nr:AER079Cp [Eremothecium gossypii ATCC 10895]Q757D4.1 RecName: Full=Biogenesis of lysosome-related organelles complex 1 subunit BLS1; Short=BLOC-1 subunit BLS1; AltName: Full=BLOS1-homolog [Eremothecium gossypii ATCC 10895]AAS52763.1 AER079Cp [Eremothecium gossypii ATCC 10895]AEY97069.1 FAER079Cp [Eremothecium gossypii FDAG1]
MELDQDVNRIIKSKTATKVSAMQAEIEANHAYIYDVQLKKLLRLHDEELQERCHTPLRKLYAKYSSRAEGNRDLQTWAEHVERDLRLLETTLRLVREGKAQDTEQAPGKGDRIFRSD